jgi:hypothetical protein
MRYERLLQLIGFKEWAKLNCTISLFNDIDLAVNNYVKSINSIINTDTATFENKTVPFGNVLLYDGMVKLVEYSIGER